MRLALPRAYHSHIASQLTHGPSMTHDERYSQPHQQCSAARYSETRMHPQTDANGKQRRDKKILFEVPTKCQRHACQLEGYETRPACEADSSVAPRKSCGLLHTSKYLPTEHPSGTAGPAFNATGPYAPSVAPGRSGRTAKHSVVPGVTARWSAKRRKDQILRKRREDPGQMSRP